MTDFRWSGERSLNGIRVFSGVPSVDYETGSYELYEALWDSVPWPVTDDTAFPSSEPVMLTTGDHFQITSGTPTMMYLDGFFESARVASAHWAFYAKGHGTLTLKLGTDLWGNLEWDYTPSDLTPLGVVSVDDDVEWRMYTVPVPLGVAEDWNDRSDNAILADVVVAGNITLGGMFFEATPTVGEHSVRTGTEVGEEVYPGVLMRANRRGPRSTTVPRNNHGDQRITYSGVNVTQDYVGMGYPVPIETAIALLRQHLDNNFYGSGNYTYAPSPDIYESPPNNLYSAEWDAIASDREGYYSVIFPYEWNPEVFTVIFRPGFYSSQNGFQTVATSQSIAPVESWMDPSWRNAVAGVPGVDYPEHNSVVFEPGLCVYQGMSVGPLPTDTNPRSQIELYLDTYVRRELVRTPVSGTRVVMKVFTPDQWTPGVDGWPSPEHEGHVALDEVFPDTQNAGNPIFRDFTLPESVINGTYRSYSVFVWGEAGEVKAHPPAVHTRWVTPSFRLLRYTYSPLLPATEWGPGSDIQRSPFHINAESMDTNDWDKVGNKSWEDTTGRLRSQRPDVWRGEFKPDDPQSGFYNARMWDGSEWKPVAEMTGEDTS